MSFDYAVTMDLRKLQHAVLLAEERSFSRASGAAHLTQPALSRSIQALEQELGLTLFERSSTGVYPTAAGIEIISLARALLRDAAGLGRQAEMLRTGEAGNVRFGIGPMFAVILTPLLSKAVARHPSLQLDIEIDAVHRLIEPLRSDRIDFCVAAIDALANEPDLVVTSVTRWQYGYFVRAGHPLADRDVGVDDLSRFPIASSRVPSSQELPRPMTLDRIAWRGHILCADSHALKRVALESDAVLLAMGPTIEPEHHDGLLKRLRYAPDRDWSTAVGVAWRKGRPLMLAAERIIADLQQAMRDGA